MNYFSILAGAAVSIAVQILFLRYTAVADVTPDLVLIFVAWQAVRFGQIPGMVLGFVLGFIVDVLSGGIVGAGALAKTIVGFIAGSFYHENKSEQRLMAYPILLIILFASVVHNIVYFFFFVQGTEISFFEFLLRYGLAAALYTTVIATVPMLYASRRGKRLRT